jgi:predicted DNA binding CopG/RHH family protein
MKMNKMNKLDREETELVASYDAEEWHPVEDVQLEMKRYQAYARETFRKDQRVNIRISRRDLQEIQKRAIAEGIPYQTLMASILHKYISGTLVSKQLWKLLLPQATGITQSWKDIEALFLALGAELSEGNGSRVRVNLNIQTRLADKSLTGWVTEVLQTVLQER